MASRKPQTRPARRKLKHVDGTYRVWAVPSIGGVRLDIEYSDGMSVTLMLEPDEAYSLARRLLAGYDIVEGIS